MKLLARAFTIIVASLAFSATASAQAASLSKFPRATLGIRPEDAPKPGDVYDVFISTGTVPITFNKLVKDENGKYKVGPQLGLGVGYIGVLGKMVVQNGNNVEIRPGLIFGLSGDIGVREEEGELETAFSVGGILGFNLVAVTGGYDFLGESPYIGLSTKLDFFALSRDKFLTHWSRKVP